MLLRMLNSKRVILKAFGNKKPIKISHGIVRTPFGEMFLAFVNDLNESICFLNFTESGIKGKENYPARYETSLLRHWPNAILSEASAEAQKIANVIFDDGEATINVVVTGTPFQESVWKELLNIPSGQTCTYGDIAKRIDKPKAVRAVGTAVGSNAVSIVIPCHRVVSKNGEVKYGGGRDRKINFLRYEYEEPKT